MKVTIWEVLRNGQIVPSDGAIYAAHSRRQFSDEENAIFDEALSKVGRVIHEGEIVPTKTVPHMTPRERAFELVLPITHQGTVEVAAEWLMDEIAKVIEAAIVGERDARKVAEAVAAEQERCAKVIYDWISRQRRTARSGERLDDLAAAIRA